MREGERRGEGVRGGRERKVIFKLPLGSLFMGKFIGKLNNIRMPEAGAFNLTYKLNFRAGRGL